MDDKYLKRLEDLTQPVSRDDRLKAVDEIERLQDDIKVMKAVILRDEKQLQQWEKRARETHTDLMRLVGERDQYIEKIEQLRTENENIKRTKNVN